MNNMKNVDTGTYGLPWLDSVLEENLLPGAPWHKVKEEIASLLAVEVKKSLLEEDLPNQAIYQLLGKTFVEKYLTNVLVPSLPYTVTSPEQDEESIKEAQRWLQFKVEQISFDLGFNLDAEKPGEENASQSMIDLSTFIQESVTRGMERELFIVEQKYSQERKANCIKEATDVCGAEKGPKGFKNPAFGSFQSETLGKAVGAILQQDCSKMERICQQLHGKQLPNSLRKIIWKIRLTQAESPTKTKLESENKLVSGDPEEFKQLGFFAHRSALESVIKRAVKEMYNGTPGLGAHVVTAEQEELAISAMNYFCNMSKRAYEPRQILLLYPIICTFGDTDSTAGAAPHLMASLLAQLMDNCFPTRPQLFSMADQVLERLNKEDRQFFTHLVRVTREEGPSEPKEFLLNYIKSELDQAQAFDKNLRNNILETLSKDTKDLMSHPIIFLRKWIGEGFVSVLRCSAVLMVWDQCFLSGWKPSVMINTCLMLLQLLRKQLMTAENYQEVKYVLLEQPSFLYTHDIQQGLVYLENGGTLRDVATVSQATRPRSNFSLASSLQMSSFSHPATAETAGQDDESTPDTEDGQSAATDDDLPPLGPLWVARTMSRSVTDAVANDEQFDIYIDEVRFIIDNATIIKVTGRILGLDWQKPKRFDLPDIEAFPELDSPSRCPQFKFKYTVRVPSEGLPAGSVLLLRVYTLDVDTGEQVVIGNCAVDLYSHFDDQVQIRVGGYQLRLKHALPSSSVPPSEEAFAELCNVPCTSILVRLCPHSEEFVKPPGYESGYYQSDNCEPSESETRVYKHFCNVHIYPPSVREAVYDVREGEEGEDIPTETDAALLTWYKDRLAKHRLRGEPATPIDLTRAVTYDQNMGVAIKVEQAFGLPDALFANALVYINDDHVTRQSSTTTGALPGDEKMVTNARNFDSQQKSPRWLDEPKIFHPSFNALKSVVIRLYAVDGVYSPRADRAGPGPVCGRKKDQNPVLVPEGWTVLQLFDKSCVNAGTHHLPLFQGSPSSAFMEFLTSNQADYSLREAIRQNFHKPQGTSSVVVRIWDAHFSLEECVPLPLKDDSLTIGNPDKYIKTAEGSGGKPISQVVLNTLPRQERKKGTSSQQYMEEKAFYEEAMNNTFLNLMESILLQSGLGPM